MTYSQDCVDLVKQSEGFSAHPYKDSAGYGTIGYGHKIVAGEDFEDGLTVSEAETLMRADLDKTAGAVNELVKVPLSQGQFDALTDFAFNLGAANLRNSTLLRKLNSGYGEEVPAELLRWVYAGGEKLPGLVTRRQREVALWNKEKA
jgi:lysozyme